MLTVVNNCNATSTKTFFVNDTLEILLVGQNVGLKSDWFKRF